MNFHVPPTSMHTAHTHTHTHRLHLSKLCCAPPIPVIIKINAAPQTPFSRSSSPLSIPTKENIISFFPAKMGFGDLKGDCG